MAYRLLRNAALLGTLIMMTAALIGCSDGDDDPMGPGGGGDGDTTAPAVTWVFPQDGTLMVPVMDSVMIEFNEPMDPASAAGEITMSHGSVESVDWVGDTSLMVGYSGVPQGIRFTMTVGTGIKDVAGNGLKAPAVYNYGSWSDDLAMFEMSPADGATDINRSSSIILDFVALMEASSVTSGITIDDGTKAPLAFEATSTNQSTWILKPILDLPANTEITVTIGTSVMSVEATTYPEPYTFSFTTNDQIDMTPPTIVSFDPPHMATMPANQTAMTITFSEPINPDRFKPSHMNGQLWWLLDQAQAEPSFDATFTVLTVPLPAELPAGLPLEATFVDFEDMIGNVQTVETEWEVTVAGQADPYPASDGDRWLMIGEWAEGLAGSENPTQTGEEWIYNQFTARGGSGEWNREEYEDESYQVLDFYEIQKITSSALVLEGFAENEGSGFQEFLADGPLTFAEFPYAVGNTWTSSASFTIPGEGVLDVDVSGEVVDQEDLILGERDGILITWTGAWQITLDIDLSAGGSVTANERNTIWVAPGVGVVREMYREDNLDPEEMYWHRFDRWREVDTPR